MRAELTGLCFPDNAPVRETGVGATPPLLLLSAELVDAATTIRTMTHLKGGLPALSFTIVSCCSLCLPHFKCFRSAIASPNSSPQ